MSDLYQKLKAGLDLARITRDQGTASVLSLAISEIENERSRKNSKTPEKIIENMVKTCESNMSIDGIDKQSNFYLKSKLEHRVLSGYLPEPLPEPSEDHIECILRSLQKSERELSFGEIMKEMKKRLTDGGYNYDGGRISKLIKQLNSGK